MEQRPTYEVLIAGKLERLPVPDMADAIWARIERQLDIDLPTNDGGTDPAPSPPSGPGSMGWGLSVLLVALVSAFLLFNKEPKTTAPATQVPSPAIEQITSPEQNSNGPPQPADRTSIATPNIVPQETPQAKSVGTPPADSLIQQPVVSTATPLGIPDSLRTVTAPPLVTTPVAKDSVQTGRKKRGVQGITPDDYRIVPAQKDSS